MILCSARVTSDFFRKVIKQTHVGAAPAPANFLQGRQCRGVKNTLGFLKFKGAGACVRRGGRSVASDKEEPDLKLTGTRLIFPPWIPPAKTEPQIFFRTPQIPERIRVCLS